MEFIAILWFIISWQWLLSLWNPLNVPYQNGLTPLRFQNYLLHMITTQFEEIWISAMPDGNGYWWLLVKKIGSFWISFLPKVMPSHSTLFPPASKDRFFKSDSLSCIQRNGCILPRVEYNGKFTSILCLKFLKSLWIFLGKSCCLGSLLFLSWPKEFPSGWFGILAVCGQLTWGTVGATHVAAALGVWLAKILYLS